jgi:hypothetical protein
MVQAVDRATVQILFVQAANDFSTEPSIVLSTEMDRVKKPNKRMIFPPHGTTPEQGHALCRDVDAWGAEVLSWIQAAMP